MSERVGTGAWARLFATAVVRDEGSAVAERGRVLVREGAVDGLEVEQGSVAARVGDCAVQITAAPVPPRLANMVAPLPPVPAVPPLPAIPAPPAPPALPDIPEEAHAACANRASGSKVTLKLGPGETMTGLCEREDGKMVFQLRTYHHD